VTARNTIVKPNIKKQMTKDNEKKYPIRSRSWVNEDAKSYGGAMLKAWYKGHPEYIDEDS
jgi:hypothetical protein